LIHKLTRKLNSKLLWSILWYSRFLRSLQILYYSFKMVIFAKNATTMLFNNTTLSNSSNCNVHNCAIPHTMSSMNEFFYCYGYFTSIHASSTVFQLLLVASSIFFNALVTYSIYFTRSRGPCSIRSLSATVSLSLSRPLLTFRSFMC
jgi:hypothetical protein